MRITSLIMTCFFIAGCTTTTSLSDLQRRSIEAKELEGSFEDAFKATMSVLQDKGYIIDNADYKVGLIKGATGADKKSLQKYIVSATIEQFGDNLVKERVVFVREEAWGLGSQIIQDPKFLEEIYDAIQKEIFVRKNLSK